MRIGSVDCEFIFLFFYENINSFIHSVEVTTDEEKINSNSSDSAVALFVE